MPNPKNIESQGFHTNPERINKLGRPKKLPGLDELLLDVLGDGEKKNEGKAILEALLKRAKKGDVRAAEVLFDRGWGKVKQSVEFTVPEEQVFIIGGREIKFG